MPALGEWGPLASNALAIVLVLCGAFVWGPKLINKTVPDILKQRSDEIEAILEHCRQERVAQEDRHLKFIEKIELRHAADTSRTESRIDNVMKLLEGKLKP